MATRTLSDLALDHYSDRQKLVTASQLVADQMWSEVDPKRLVDSWAAQVPELTAVVSGAQLGAARPAAKYTDESLAEQEVEPAAVADPDPASFAGQAADGGPLMRVLTNPVFVTLASIQDGFDVISAMSHGRHSLGMVVGTEVADAGRLADQVAITSRRGAHGYIRLAVGNSCARCLILAGREYTWSAGFQRHPRCDCQHIPAGIGKAGLRSLMPDPEAMYARMTAAERTRAGFTLADQRAIADGADLNQVVNAKRGMYMVGSGPSKRKLTNESTTRRGVVKRRQRLSVDECYRVAAGDRDEALALLRQNGYLFDGGPKVVEKAIPLPVAAAKDPALSMRVADLKAIARQNNVPIGGLTKKDEIVARLREFEAGNGRLAGLPEFAEPVSAPKLAAPSKDLIITGQSADGWTDLVPGKVPADGLRVRQLEVLPDRAGKSYVVEHGTVFRDGDVLYLVEHGPDEYGSAKVARAIAEMRQAHAAIPAAARANKSYAYLERQSPFDDYYRRKHNDPTHTASMSAGEGRVVMWNREKWPRVNTAEVRHETGHNLDDLVGRDGSRSKGWSSAADADAKVRIEEFDGRGRITPGVDKSRDFPGGVTDYGKSSAQEDFAESVMLYQLGPIARGRVAGESTARDLYFRDIFPARAKILDRQFPELAREQQAAVEALRTPRVKVSTKNSRTGQPEGYPKRQPVSEAQADWSTPYPKYDPPEYTAPSVLANDRTKKPGGWADPEDPRKVGREFHSSTGPVRVDEQGRPINPVTRTGIQGRGLLGKWGPNQAADPIVTRINPRTGKLEIAVIKRGDTGDWAIPGGMVDDGEQLSAALARELREETGADLDMAGAREVYRGYVDDPRNTDNAWMETTVMHRHLTPQEAAKVEFGRGGLDTGEVRAIQWAEVDDEFLAHMYASHGEFIRAALKDMPTARPLAPKEFTRLTAESAKGAQALKAAPLRMTQPGAKHVFEGFDVFSPADAKRIQASLVQYERSGFQHVNEFLRTGKLSGRGAFPISEAEAKAMIRDLNQAFAQSRLTQSVTVYRGLGTGRGVFGDPASWPADLAGREFTEAGFFSTSASKKVADEFGDVQLRIVVPEGHPALVLSGMGREAESEILLPPGTRFRVVKDRGVVGGKRSLDVEVVPAGATTTEVVTTTATKTVEVAPEQQIRNLLAGKGTAPKVPTTGPLATGYGGATVDELRVLAESRYGHLGKIAPKASRDQLLAALRSEMDLTDANVFKREAARLLQLRVERGQALADILAEAAEQTFKRATPEAMKRSIEAIARQATSARTPVPPAFLQGVLRAAQAGDRAKVEAALRRLGQKYKIRLDGMAGDVSKFREGMEATVGGGLKADLDGRIAGLSTVPEVRAVQIDNRVRAAYRDLQRRPGDWVPLADLRESVGDISRAELDDALRRMGETPGVHLIPWDNTKALTPRDHEAAVRFGGGPNHALRLEDPSPHSLPAGAETGMEVRITRPGATIELPTGETRLRNAVVREVDAQERARIRQEAIDEVRKRAEVLTEVAQLVQDRASTAVLRERLSIRLKLQGLEGDKDLAAFVRAVQTGDAAKIAKASQAAAKKLGLTQVDEAGALSVFDPKRFQIVTGGERIAQGAQVRVVRPGFEYTLNGETITLSKPVVEALSDVEVAQIRQQAVDTAKGLVDLQAELAGGPAQRRIAIEAAQLPDDIKAALLAASRVSPAKLKTTLTAQMRKSGVTVGKAPKTPVKFDPKTMEVKGGAKLPVGTKVRVVEPEVTVVHQGETVVVRKAVVEPPA